MADFSLSELATSVGVRSGNFLKDVTNAAGNFACGLYKDYPGVVLAGGLAGDFGKGLMDTLCASRPAGLPIAPRPPYRGGQCDGVLYRCSWILLRSDGLRYDFGYGTGNPNGGVLYGPIAGVKCYRQPWGEVQFDVVCRGIQGFGLLAQPQPVRIRIMGGDFTTNWEPIAVVRDDGAPDNCGDLPAMYPTDPIPAHRLTDNDEVTYNDGTKINVPLVYAPVQPKFGVTVNVGEIPITFDFSGAKISLGTDSADLQELEDAIKRIESDVKDIQDKLPKPIEPPSSGDYDETETSEDSSEAKENLEGLQWIQIELTRSPTNAKKQYGREAQDVVYAGWFQFSVDGFYLPREPIHFKRSVYAAPDGCTGYAYTLYEGFRATVKEFKKKVEPTEQV